MDDTTAVPIGLSIIGFSIIVQIVCLILTCCLVKKRQGGETVNMRIWLLISLTFDQTMSLVFHLQYHYFILPISGIKFCIILRMTSGFLATFTVMWMLTISMFYLISTLNSTKQRVFLNSCFLSHCVTWSWSVIGCAMYGIVTFMTENGGESYIKEKCWMDIGDTVHLHFTHGFELIAYSSLIICAIILRFRISSRRHLTSTKQSYQRGQPEYNLEYDVNILLCLCLLLSLYYCALYARLILVESGSDLSIMIIQGVKALFIALFMCFLDKNIIALIKCSLPTPTREYQTRRSQGSLVSNSSIRTTRSSNTSKFVFD